MVVEMKNLILGSLTQHSQGEKEKHNLGCQHLYASNPYEFGSSSFGGSQTSDEISSMPKQYQIQSNFWVTSQFLIYGIIKGRDQHTYAYQVQNYIQNYLNSIS